MKRLFLAFVLMLILLLPFLVQSQTVYYVSSSENFANPERGFYHHTETHSGSYSPLSQSVLNTYRAEGISQILRVFYLESFLNAPISSAYLTNIHSDFAKVRAAGLKCIVRFAYSDDEVIGLNNANKARILQHIEQLAPVVNQDRDVIACFQAGFVGAWGEWYNTDYFGIGNLTPQNWSDRKEVTEAMMQFFPADRQIQVRTPKIKQNLYGSAALTSSLAYGPTAGARIAHHNDCFLASADDYGTYVNITAEYPYLEQETKYLVMGGEMCAPSSYSGCLNAIDKLNKFSWDYLNSDYHETVLSTLAAQGCVEEIKRRLGYRFELISSTVDASGITITFENTGFGHLYNSRPVYLVCQNLSTGSEIMIPANTDPRLWLKGAPISISIDSGNNLPDGEYSLYLYLPDPLINGPSYAVRFANNNVWQPATGYNGLGQKFEIRNLSIVESHSPSPYMIQYNQLELSNEVSTFELYNIIGQKVRSGNDRRTDLSSLPVGVYLLRLDNRNARKIIISNF